MSIEEDVVALKQRLEIVEHQLAVQQDIHQIRRIQYTYGYFIDKSMYNEVVDLFSDTGEVWFLGGIYKGKAGVRRLYIERFQTHFTQGHNGPRYGWLLEHPQLQMVIDVNKDRTGAKVRGRSTMQAGLHESAEGEQRAWWEGGIYENEYSREDGVWKIKALRYYPFWHGSFAEGWPRRRSTSSRWRRPSIRRIRPVPTRRSSRHHAYGRRRTQCRSITRIR